jgi:hypothetical protein
MLFDPAVSPQPLEDVVAQARTELRVQAETLPPTLHDALRAAHKRGVSIQYLLGPKAAYTLDARGQPMVARRPFDNGPQGADLALADTTGQAFINPRFSELGPGDRFQPGVRSHAFYVVAGDRAALCSTAPRPAPIALCFSGGAGLAAALTALFTSEFNETLEPHQRAALLRDAARAVVATPEDAAPLLALLAAPGAIVMTSGLDQGAAFAQLVRSKPKTLIVPPELARAPAVEAARRAGVSVVARTQPFKGTAIWAPAGAFLGSQRLTDAALGRDRDAGVMFSGRDADALRAWMETR